MVRLSPDTHGRLGWRKARGFGFARKLGSAPIAFEEIPRVAQYMPVLFRKVEQVWQAVAVMGPVPDSNLQVASDGKWRDPYVPAILRAYPFRMTGDGAGLELWPGYEHEPLSGKGVEPLYFNGQLSPLLSKTLEFLRALENGIRKLHAPLCWLDRHQVLRPWGVPGLAETADQPRHNDLFCIDRQALQALDEEALIELGKIGDVPSLLSCFHTHLDSLPHAERFRDRAWEIVSAAIRPKEPERKSPSIDDFLAAMARGYAASE